MILATLCSIGPLQSHLLTCCKLLLLERNKGAKISHIYSITHLTLTVLCFIEYTVYKQTPVLQPTTHTQQGKPPFVLTPMLLQWNNNRCFQTPAFPTVPPQFKSQLHRDIWPSLSPSSPQHEPPPSPAWGTPHWFHQTEFHRWERKVPPGNQWPHSSRTSFILGATGQGNDVKSKNKREINITRAPVPH